MTYSLGIDVGTTWTAAAVAREGRVDIIQLGTHTSSIPSVVLMREDGTVLTGEAAQRRAVSEPDRVAREFKRRMGDQTPLLLGGRPQSPEAITAQLLRAVVDHVTTLEGAPPAKIAITHPANWGEYKLDLMRQAVRIAGLDDAVLLSEPEAAAIHYAASERIPDGAKVAVYDLGGGTFDAAVLEKHGNGFSVLGPPEGIERLGGIDFDAAVLHQLMRGLEGDLTSLDADPVAAARLRSEAIAAKEALSSDTDVAVPVLLPGVQGNVRMTREEFEDLIRPSLDQTVDALHRALEAAGVAPEDLHAVLLVGGSSRIPLVADVVGNALGRPVAVDSHPKHVVPMGAARVAWLAHSEGTAAVEGDTVATEPIPATEPVTVRSGSRRGLLVGVASVVVLAGLVGTAFATGMIGSSEDDPISAETTTTTTTTTAPTTTTTSTTTTTAPTTTTTTAPTTTTTTLPERYAAPHCFGDVDCIAIGIVTIENDELRIVWEATFEPSTSGKHAHFFWDIYEPNQVGTNAAALGGVRAPWELTANQDFVPSAEMRLANRPEDATGICVTPANGSHGVIDPEVYDCELLPDGA